jgi:hypothetical protein
MPLDSMNIIILFASGLLAVTTIDVLGSLSSRRMNYKYAYLTPISFLVSFCIGYQGHSIATLPWTLVIACLTGIYDGTIGWRLSIILKANFADKEDYTKNLSLSSRISGMIVVSGIFGFLGFMTAGHI